MRITESALRTIIRQILFERIEVIDKNNIEEKMDFLKDIYQGHFNWQLNNNRYNRYDSVLNYSVILTEELVEVLFSSKKGVVLNPPSEFEDSEFDPEFRVSHDRTPEKKYHMDFKKTRWANRFKLDIDRVQTNLRNEDPKWGGFKFSEDMTDLKRVVSGEAAEAFIEFINYIILWTDNKIKKGRSPRAGSEENITRGMEPLRISGQIFADEI